MLDPLPPVGLQQKHFKMVTIIITHQMARVAKLTNLVGTSIKVSANCEQGAILNIGVHTVSSLVTVFCIVGNLLLIGKKHKNQRTPRMAEIQHNGFRKNI